MPKLGRRKILKIKLETNMGEAVTPDLLLLVYDPELNPSDNLIQREPSGGFGGQIQAAHGPRIGTCKFKCELRGNGTASLDAGLLAALQACGALLTSSVLTPATPIASQKTATIELSSDGRVKRLYGAAGTWTLSGEFGKQVFLDFTFNGIYSVQADAALPSVSQTSYAPMMGQNLTLSLGGHTPRVSKLGFNPGNTIEAREDVTAAQGIAHYLVAANRRPLVDLDVEIEAGATWDPEDLWVDSTQGALSAKFSDGTVDVTLAAPKVQILPPQEALRGSKAIYNLQGQCNMNLGDDEWTITAAAHGA